MAEIIVGSPIQLNANTSPKIDVIGLIELQNPADCGAEI